MTKESHAVRSGRLRIAAALVALLALGATGCDKLKARDMLNKGVQAYKAQQFDDAVEKFKVAKEKDPTMLNARLYLATAYASLYVDGSPTAANVEKGNHAVAEFQDVLSIAPSNLSAIDGLGSILYRMGGQPFDPKKLEESRSFHLQHIKISPNDPDPYYWVGVIDWLLSFRANAAMRSELNAASPKKPLKESDPLPAKLREEFSSKYSADVDEGIANLKKAIDLRPDYSDAMAYLNLLDRQKADQVEAGAERDGLLADADALIEKVKVINQKKLEKAQPQG